MDNSNAVKITKDLLAPFHFSSLEDAGLNFLYLSSLAKISEYRKDCLLYQKKYGMSYESFKKHIAGKKRDEVFEEEDDLMAWQYVYDALQYWENKVKELDQCF
ncbi:conserved hypothetical protein [Desulfamplus magnetovallimortis]|uniref:Uncharacterized protein n=1 Tax=Desulfamplus magnetovallimortis TaxID=1246637 RepID=A0A1W1HCZ1_9BACT|nr:hypothetical protein [Desulfamplus magnetovallimortis]SLM30364.1 conserved hypothetical protein [Desulfamplus magnetovallimortis]